MDKKEKIRRTFSRVLFYTAAAAFLIFCVWLGSSHRRAADSSPDVHITQQPTFSATFLPKITASPVYVNSPTPTPDGLTAMSGTSTVVWMSDTQHYPVKAPEVLKQMTLFLSDERTRMNLDYIVHTGDFVDDRDDIAQWEVVASAMETLNNIPYGVLAGNHDGGSDSDFSRYVKYFGEEVLRNRPESAYYGGSYKNNRGHYDLVNIGENRFIFAYMSYAPDADGIKWLNGVFKEYRDRVGVLCLHDYFKSDMSYSSSGATLYKNVVKKNSNVYLVLCGHRYSVGHKKRELDDNGDGQSDRRVYELMQNYQAAGQTGGSGYMQFLQFDDIKKEVRVISYSPYTDDRRYYDTPGAELEKYPVDPEQEEYTFSYPWK
jgi:predicted phosphodiesterase